ncbi:metal-dependent hydrolase [Halococcus sp. PRR34]|uniref:metal-dependent hydrolase n=1 Tax=Halococcus sp. PRR34 TaxID=3020830 RepID=UPI00235F22BE|nr:metal-dependent hydrolase [Halococcus sp. PRR34]
MYRQGHIGVGLLLYAPAAYAMVSAGRLVLAIVGFGVMIWLAMLPDVDMRLPFVSHRGPTHTLGFAVIVGLACGAIGWVLGTELTRFEPQLLGSFGFGLGALVVVAHLVADWLTPMRIAPFWPLSSHRFSLGFARASSTLANGFLFVLGAGATAVVLWFTGLIG